MLLSLSFTLATLAIYASAQSLSSECTSALLGIASNPDASKCLTPSPLLSIATSPNASVITPVDNWLTSMCAAQACSNDTLAAVLTNVTAGCQTELAGTGLTTDTVSSIIPIVQTFYPAVREIVCLKDGNTNCVTQTLTNLQSVTGTLTLSEISALISNPPTNLPSNVTCTNCVKAAYNIVNQTAPSLVSDVTSSLQSQCGTSFLDGATPSSIVQSASASGASTAADSGALPAAFISGGALAGLGTSGVVVISTIFSFLA
ncbi:hypothetical protein BDQ17DRAFT_1232492 [Cyathus striatus]|nr:hypothetical protein BDQ17DRAFT_1232492 [Cyathus striatus]